MKKRFSRFTPGLLAWILLSAWGNGHASAQAGTPRLFAAKSGAVHPYARGQWTKEQCDTWEKKYGPIIGINHPDPPCGAVGQEEAIRLASEIGFNSVRWWPSGEVADEYIRSVEQWAAWADEYNMTVSPVFGFPQSYYYRKDKDGLEKTVREIIRHFRNDDRIVLWDIWNEPAFNGSDCQSQMEWIKDMIVWCREEGCTQPISASIVWDAEIVSSMNKSSETRKIRDETESMMDVHNFHDYCVQEDHGKNVSVMVSRLKETGDRPLVCTECLTRTNGSGVARTLSEFSKHRVHFYTWGLYASDSNWEVAWGRSTYYAWEPMFHNLLYADGEPYDPAELDVIRNFRFAAPGEKADPGAEVTERWTERRAWKWMSHGPLKGLCADNIDNAMELVRQCAGSPYNTISVQLRYSDYAPGAAASFYEQFDNLLKQAEEAGVTVLPTMLADGDLSTDSFTLADAIFKMISRYYDKGSVKGWNLYTQQESDDVIRLTSLMPYLFRYVRFAFPNQPLFATPALSDAAPDTSGEDAANLLWRLSDVVAYVAPHETAVNGELLNSLCAEYRRPLFCMRAYALQEEFASLHVNWYAAKVFEREAANRFAFEYAVPLRGNRVGKMEGWTAYAHMNRNPVKGICYDSVEDALAGVTEKGSSGLYNSVRVQLNFDSWLRSRDKFRSDFDDLLRLANGAGMTVLPSLVSDTYALRDMDTLMSYVADMIGRYDKNGCIIAWDLYFRPCAQSGVSKEKADYLLDGLFEAAHGASPSKPVFATPEVSTEPFTEGYDYIKALVHGQEKAGWNKLRYMHSSESLCYKVWCLSDVIAYASSQDSPEMGWLNSVAYRFGRPLFCTKWHVPEKEDPSKALSVFSNMHVSWYADGELDDAIVRDFGYAPVITTAR